MFLARGVALRSTGAVPISTSDGGLAQLNGWYKAVVDAAELTSGQRYRLCSLAQRYIKIYGYIT